MVRFVAIVFVAGCVSETALAPEPIQGSLAWHLGESTVSPGNDPTRPPPIAADDPRVMNVSRPIRRLPDAVDVIVVEPPPEVNPATSSTPVDIPPDIAPASTTEVHGEPGVNSPPPPPPGYR